VTMHKHRPRSFVRVRGQRLLTITIAVLCLTLSVFVTPAPVTARAQTPAAPFDPAAFAFALEPVADGFERPVDVVDAGDGSGRLFVVEQEGRIEIIRDGAVVEEAFLDLTELVGCCGERGLLSLIFHPRYAENGLFYVDYTDKNGDTQIIRYNVSADDPDRAEPASAATILSVAQPAANHNGGRLLFGADGYLYVSLGDGGGGNGQNGQKLDTLLGKILRIDVDREENGLPYAIPPDNPFAGVPDARPEIWVYGLRNPWRMAFDRATGDLWIGDVGSSIYEEIDLVPAGSGGGLNFGWNAMEGFDCRDGDDADCADFVPPISGFDRDTGCVVTGGTVYRGAAVPALTGIYLFADYCGAGFWGLGRDAAGNWITAGPILPDHRVVSFGEDAAGELYVVDLDGGISRIVAA
jgi:glucose/arabinose dehydrogenase